MYLKKTLRALTEVVVREAEKNYEFRKNLEEALSAAYPQKSDKSSAKTELSKKSNRRQQAIIDPVELARVSETLLREKLAELDLNQLLDVVAQYAMDPSKLVMKWKDRSRICDKIVESSLTRATKGDAFRSD